MRYDNEMESSWFANKLTEELMDLKAELWAGLRKVREILKSDGQKAKVEAFAELTRLQDLLVRDKQRTGAGSTGPDPLE